MKIIKNMAIAFSFLALSFQMAYADEAKVRLAKESETAAVASSSTPATPEMLVEKINRGCDLLQKEGKSSFAKFKGKDSEFIFAGTYIWIHDSSTTMRMHPIKYKLEGKRLIGLKDSVGKRFFALMTKVVKDEGAGWVSYMWPKPGDKKPSQKISYVKKCAVEGETLVLGSGVYDMSPEKIDAKIR